MPSDFVWHLNRYTSIEFGQQHYDFLAKLLSWSLHRNVRTTRRDNQVQYTMGENQHVLELHAGMYADEFLSSNGDATRVARSARRRNGLIVGKCHDPDPDKWASTWAAGFPVPRGYLHLIEMVRILRSLHILAHEVYTEILRATSVDLPILPYVVIAEPNKGMSGFIHLKWWLSFNKLHHQYGLNVVVYTCDCCSTGVSAFKLLNTPSAAMVAQGVTYLGLNRPYWKYFAAYVRPAYPTDSPHFKRTPHGIPPPKFVILDPPHGIRSCWRGLASEDKKLLFNCTDIDDIGSYQMASMLGFQELARDTSLEKYGLKAVININEFFEQRTEKAFNMIKLQTIQLYATHEATKNDKATRLALKGLYFIFEPFRNKNLTNPHWAVEMVSRGFHVWEFQQRYVRHAVAAKPVHDFMFSYQVLEQFCSLSQGLVLWYLTWHRHRNGDPKWKWARCQVTRINEDLQEDLHRRVRQQTRRNDVNCTVAEFLEFLTRSLEASDSELWLRSNGMDASNFPAGTCQTKDGDGSLGLWVEPGESVAAAKQKLSFKSQVPDKDYDRFADALAAAWEKGFMWARKTWEEEFPISVQQLEVVRQWSYPASGLPVFPDFTAERPAGMRIAAGHVSSTQLPSKTVEMDDTILSEKAKRAMQKIAEDIRKERESHKDQENAGDIGGVDDVDDSVEGLPRFYDLAAEAQDYRDGQTSDWDSLSLTAKAKKKERVGDSDMPMNMAVQSALLEGKDGAIWHTDQVLSKEFRSDRVPVSRDRRFWVFRMPEWRVAMLEGHDSTYGTCFIVKWSTVNRFAVVRIRSMAIGKTKVHSFKWDAKDRNHSFRVEVMTPTQVVETRSQLYATSGYHIGPITSALVLQPVELLRNPDSSGTGLLVVDEICKLKKKKLQQIVVNEGFLQLEVAKMSGRKKNKMTLECVEGWGQEPCTRCRSSWFGPKKGCLVRCKVCTRVFHQQCYKPKIMAKDKDDWTCQVCSGQDTDLCEKCGWEWSQQAEDADSSDEDDNQLLQCEACQKWYHQYCHAPIIKPIPATFQCTSCAPEAWAKEIAARAVKAAKVAKAKEDAKVKEAAAMKAKADAAAGKAAAGSGGAAAGGSGGAAIAAEPITTGSLVEVVYKGWDKRCHGRKYPGVVADVNNNGSLYIQYDDDDSEDDVDMDRVQLDVTAIAAERAAEEAVLAEASGVGRKRGGQSAHDKCLHEDARVPAAARMGFRNATTRRESGTWTGLDPAACAREKKQQQQQSKK